MQELKFQNIDLLNPTDNLVKTLIPMPAWKFGNKKAKEEEEVEEIVEEVEVEVDSNGEEIEYVEEEVEVEEEEEEEEEEEVQQVPAKRAPATRKGAQPALSGSDAKVKEVFSISNNITSSQKPNWKKNVKM